MLGDYSQLFDNTQQVEVSSSSSRDILGAPGTNAVDCGVDQPDPVQPKQVSTFLGHPQRLMVSGCGFRFSSTLQIHPNKKKSRPDSPIDVALRLSSAAKEIKYVRPIGSPWLGGKRTQGKCALFLFVLTSNIVLLNDNLTVFTALMSDDAFSLFETMVNFR